MFEILRCWGSAFSDQPLCDLHGWILEQPFGTPAAICTPIQKAWRMWHPVHPSTFPNCKGVYIYYIVYTYYYIGYWEMDGNETLQDKNHQQHCKWNLLHSLAAVFCDRPRYRMCFLQIAKAKSLVLPRPNKVDLKKKRRRSFQQRNHFCVPPFFGRIVGLKLTQVQWGIWMLEIEVLVQLRQVPLPEFHPWGPLGTGKSLWLNWVTHQELENDKWLPCVLGVLIQLLRQVEPKPLHLKFISFFCSLNPPLIVG